MTEEEAAGPFLDYLDNDNKRMKVSSIKFPKIEKCIALVQVYYELDTNTNISERMFYAFHIPGDIVDFWRGKAEWAFTNPLAYKLRMRNALRENLEKAKEQKSRIFLAGRHANEAAIWNIFKDYHDGDHLASQTLVMDLLPQEHSATAYFNYNEVDPVLSWWHEIPMPIRVPTQVPIQKDKRCVVQ